MRKKDSVNSAGGGCLCGRVRYALSPPPRRGIICHCRMCQRAAGAFCVAWAEAALSDFHLLQGDICYCRSSPQAKRGFCGECGSPLVFVSHRGGVEDFGVTAASLDDPDGVEITAHIWAQSRRGDCAGGDGLPVYPRETPEFEQLLAAAAKTAIHRSETQ